MSQENNPAEEQHSYMILDAYESELSFYAKATGTSAEDAVRNAIAEKGDEDLLPIHDESANMMQGFIAVREDNWNAFERR